MNEEDDDLNDDHGNDDDNQDMVAEYWSSDHHKFDWSGYVQNLDPLSWHSLGLSVPESFLSKGNNIINNNGAHNLGDHTLNIFFNLPFKLCEFHVFPSYNLSIIYGFMIDPCNHQYCTSIAEVTVQVPFKPFPLLLKVSLTPIFF